MAIVFILIDDRQATAKRSWPTSWVAVAAANRSHPAHVAGRRGAGLGGWVASRVWR
jgi:hypothetical protein